MDALDALDALGGNQFSSGVAASSSSVSPRVAGPGSVPGLAVKAELADNEEKGLASPARPSARQRAPTSARKASQKADEDAEGLVGCE